MPAQWRTYPHHARPSPPSQRATALVWWGTSEETQVDCVGVKVGEELPTALAVAYVVHGACLGPQARIVVGRHDDAGTVPALWRWACGQIEPKSTRRSISTRAPILVCMLRSGSQYIHLHRLRDDSICQYRSATCADPQQSCLLILCSKKWALSPL